MPSGRSIGGQTAVIGGITASIKGNCLCLKYSEHGCTLSNAGSAVHRHNWYSPWYAHMTEYLNISYSAVQFFLKY